MRLICLCYLCQSEVNAISKWCDDQAPIQTHVLIPVAKLARTLPDHKLICVSVPVEPQLTLPFKLTTIQYATVKQLLISC